MGGSASNPKFQKMEDDDRPKRKDEPLPPLPANKPASGSKREPELPPTINPRVAEWVISAAAETKRQLQLEARMAALNSEDGNRENRKSNGTPPKPPARRSSRRRSSPQRGYMLTPAGAAAADNSGHLADDEKCDSPKRAQSQKKSVRKDKDKDKGRAPGLFRNNNKNGFDHSILNETSSVSSDESIKIITYEMDEERISLIL